MARPTIPNPVTPIDIPFTPVGAHTQNASISSATTITVPDGAIQWMVQTQTQNVRFTLDETAPTTTVGFLLVADATPVIVPCYPGQKIKVIEVAATAKLDYQFGR